MKKKRPVDPELRHTLHELEDIVERLGYKMRYEKGNFEGGYCLLKESRLFVINSRKEAVRKVSIIAKNLKEIGIDQIFIKPHIRDLIERESKAFISEDESNSAEETDEE